MVNFKSSIPALPVVEIRKQSRSTKRDSMHVTRSLLLPFWLGMKWKYIFGRLVTGAGNSEVYFFS